MKTAFVTGASRGIGKAITIALAKSGYRLALVATTKEALEKVAKEAQLKDPLLFAIDVGDETLVKAAVNETIATWGHLDVLVNNAGICIKGGEGLSSSDFRAMIETNLFGAFYGIQAVVPHMKKRESGYIFNIASISGKEGSITEAGYCASKFALMGINDSFVRTLAGSHVKMTAICPGWVDTDMALKSRLPSHERISPEDIATLILTFLSLSPNCYIKECVLEARLDVALEEI